jgi:hypothetical protein
LCAPLDAHVIHDARFIDFLFVRLLWGQEKRLLVFPALKALPDLPGGHIRLRTKKKRGVPLQASLEARLKEIGASIQLTYLLL